MSRNINIQVIKKHNANERLRAIFATRYRQAKKQQMRRLTMTIDAYFAEKIVFAENKLYICRLICGE